MSAFSKSLWELTETYSPAASYNTPFASPATVANITGSRTLLSAATPTARLAVDIITSFALRTAASSQLLLNM